VRVTAGFRVALGVAFGFAREPGHGFETGVGRGGAARFRARRWNSGKRPSDPHRRHNATSGSTSAASPHRRSM
jgi:hypothetical protein